MSQHISIIEVQKLLANKAQNCGVCGSSNWELEPDLFMLKLGSPFEAKKSKKLTVALLVCHDCGNIHTIDVAQLTGKNLGNGKSNGKIPVS